MVDCFYCMKELPSKCTCDDSFRSKKLRYIRNAIRELEVIKKIYVTDGRWKPKIMMNGEFIDEDKIKVKEVDNGVELSINIPLDNREIELVLFDTMDEPLYRKILKVDGDTVTIAGDGATPLLDEEKELVLSWFLGWR